MGWADSNNTSTDKNCIVIWSWTAAPTTAAELKANVGMDCRHANAFNLTYLDGHVGAFTPPWPFSPSHEVWGSKDI